LNKVSVCIIVAGIRIVIAATASLIIYNAENTQNLLKNELQQQEQQL